MHAVDIEPLEPGLWLQRIELLAARPLFEPADIERVLRHAFHLVQLAPRPLRHILHCACDEGSFEGLLRAQAFDAAAIKLMGERTSYALSRDGGDSWIEAQVWHAEPHTRQVARERSLAAALLRAWLKCNRAMGEDERMPVAVREAQPSRLTTEH